MSKTKLKKILTSVLAALWVMAVRNPRTTALGVVGALAFIGVQFGFELSPEAQARFAAGIIVFIGLVAGDKYLKAGIR